MNFKIITTSTILVFAFTISSCKKNKEEEETNDYNFAPLLAQVGDSIIMTNYQNFSAKTTILESDFINFKNNITEANLAILQNSFLETYHAWQKVAVFNYGSGPSFDAFGRTFLNTFPTNDQTIESNISTGVYDLGLSSNIDAQGLAALDYLLYQSDLTTVTNAFSLNADRVTYLEVLISKIKTLSNQIETAWSVNGSNYLSTWKSKEGLDAGASPAILYNQFTYEIELLKKSKVGIPGGAVLGITNPTYVEAYYSAASLELLRTNIINLKNIFTGKNGTGFDDYLVHLGRTDLRNNINHQFDVILNRIDGFSSTLTMEINNNNPDVMNLYADIQQLVVYAKTEMASVMGVEISFQDSDND